MLDQREPELSAEDEKRIERDIYLLLLKGRGHAYTTREIGPLISGPPGMRLVPEPVIRRTLEKMVEEDRIWANRGIAHTSYQSQSS